LLDMTNLYNEAGSAEKCAEMLVNRPEAHALFEAQLAYRRGEIDKVYDLLRHATNKQEGIEVLSYIKQPLADGTFMP